MTHGSLVLRPVLIVFNPAAGRARARRLWRVLDVLATSGLRLDVVETRYPGHATELARTAAASATMVVAAGGDGTIAEVANGLAGTGCRLGVIPLGTANVLAHELDLPTSPEAIAAALGFGRTRPVWPGETRYGEGRRLFVQMLGAGLDAQVVHRLPARLKLRIGRMAYVVQTLRELARYPFPPIRVRLDGIEEEVASVIVTKGRLYAGGYKLAPDASVTERDFSVVLFDRRGVLPALLYGAALPFDLLHRMPGLRHRRATEVEICSRGVPMQTDGDPAGSAPLWVRNARQPIDVVVG